MQAAQDRYWRQAPRYDRTRGASWSVLEPVLAALDGAPGFELIDVGGGTGNYADALRDRGWRVTVVDRSSKMIARAGQKGLSTVQADATALPFADESVDAVGMLSMLHQVRDWRAALSEAKRVLRSGGRLAVTLLSAEHIREVTWVYWWFPSMGASALASRPSIPELLAELPGGRAVPFEINDLNDGSIAALCRFPERILDPAWRAQTTFFERLTDRDPDELERGLVRLRSELASGRRPEEECTAARRHYGDAVLIAWTRS